MCSGLKHCCELLIWEPWGDCGNFLCPKVRPKPIAEKALLPVMCTTYPQFGLTWDSLRIGACESAMFIHSYHDIMHHGTTHRCCVTTFKSPQIIMWSFGCCSWLAVVPHRKYVFCHDFQRHWLIFVQQCHALQCKKGSIQKSLIQRCLSESLSNGTFMACHFPSPCDSKCVHLSVQCIPKVVRKAFKEIIA